MMRKLVGTIAFGVFVLCGLSAEAAGVDPVLKCKDAKGKAAGLKGLTLMKAFGKNMKTPNDEKLASDISKAQSNFTKLFTKAEQKGGCGINAGGVEPEVDGCVNDLLSLVIDGTTTCGNGKVGGEEQCDGVDLGGATCGSLGFNGGGTLACTAACQYDVSACECEGLPATGQTTAYQADKNDGIPGPVDVPDDGTVRAGAPLAYVDNGDGTITDLNTGLMWEKKSDDDTLHDKDIAYLWSGNGNQETIWDWLDDVNAEGGTGFAGYSDWRIPNVRELQSIIDYERYDPSVDPVFNTGCAGGCTLTMCSCTVASYYWSSTTGAGGQGYYAWYVSFYNGNPYGISKDSLGPNVRAVRGPD